jgi:hypothetical protein
MDIGVKATLKQINLGFKDLERVAGAQIEDGKIYYALGRTKSQAKLALDDLAEAGEKLFDRFKEEVRDPKTGKVIDYRIPPTKQRAHDAILKQMLNTEVELYGYTFSVEEANTHLKPNGNEFGTLLGWLIKPDKPQDKEKGYARPNFESFFSQAQEQEEKEQGSNTLSLVNGKTDPTPVELNVD